MENRRKSKFSNDTQRNKARQTVSAAGCGEERAASCAAGTLCCTEGS